MAKILKYENDAKQKILAGVEKLEKAVSTTLGPAGKNVIIDEFGSIHSTRDGVTVAKAITLKDPFENLGANAVKEVAEKSGDRVGDGTTTSTILAANIYRNGLKYVSLGTNATQIKTGISKAAEYVIKTIKEVSKEISSEEDIKKVATVSANGDEKIGSMIADVMSKLGKDGTAKVENGNGIEMTSKIVEGMVIDQSYASPYMVTNPEAMEAELDNPWILIANKKLSNIQELVPALNSMAQTGRPVFIIADDYAEDILSTLVVNKLRGLNVCAIKSPSYGDNRKAILEDIAILCGGHVVSDETGTKLENAIVNQTGDSPILGQAKRVVVNKDNTVIFGGVGAQEDIDARAEALRTQIGSTKDKYDKEKLQERLAKLTSGVGVISVGAATEAERKELHDRVDDAFCASKAAIRSGVVAGGGITLLSAKKLLKNWIDAGNVVGNEVLGATILCDSLEAPIRKILTNAGLNAEQILMMISEKNSTTYGYDVLKGQYVDMIEDGILDPTEVVVNEIQNAASVAGLLLTTEALVVEEPADMKSQGPNSCSSCNPGGPMM